MRLTPRISGSPMSLFLLAAFAVAMFGLLLAAPASASTLEPPMILPAEAGVDCAQRRPAR